MQHPENNHDEMGLPFKKDGHNPFSSPDGYFNDLGKKLMHRIELEEELREFKMLGAIPKQQAYTVPQNYFAQQANALEYQQELASYPALAALHKPALQSPEPAYFDELEQRLLSKAEWVQELAAYPALQAIDNVHGFEMAPGYFDNLSYEVRKKIASQQHIRPGILERVIAFIFKPQVSLAFACAIAIGISFLIYKPETAVPDGNCKTLACLEKSDILSDDKVMHSLDEENLMDVVDVEKLDKQINKPVHVSDTAASREEYIIDNVNTDQLLEEL
ncbi:MAG: hypothetical protein JST26_16855 [Bacteroidetes bacterium]|nr:hypothetical protein [Bacteroidota bacterium]